MYEHYLGLDLHKREIYAVLIDKNGNKLDERKFHNQDAEQYLLEVVPINTFAVLDATRNWYFLYDLLSVHVERVELAHPNKLRAISSAAVKTDQIDASVLAQLARLNYLPIAYAAPQQLRELRLLIRHRQSLVSQRTRLKNRVHALLSGLNLHPPTSDLFGLAGREWLNEEQVLSKLSGAFGYFIEDHLQLIDQISARIAAVESAWVLTDEQKAALRLLKTIPGMGQLIAITVIAEIGDLRRFRSPKALCNWTGLTPRVRSSGGFPRYGGISKEGSPYLRAAMTRAATIASRRSKRLAPVHEVLVKRCGKKGAKVAVARRLLTVVYHMLTRNQPYQEDYTPQKIPALQGA